MFVYDLDRRWRKHLGVAHVDAYPKLEAGAGLDAETWAAQEFGDAQLGDKRRTSRLVNSVTILARAPGESITATMKSDRAAIRGYYRFIEKANERGTTPADILAPHRRRTIERMRTEKTVLCLQGRHGHQLQHPSCVRGLGSDRAQPDHRESTGGAFAYDVGVECAGVAAGRAALCLQDPSGKARS